MTKREDTTSTILGTSRSITSKRPHSGYLPRGYSLIEIMVVVAVTGVISAIAVPMMSNTLGNFRLSGDARGLTNAVSLTKMQAASNFTQARLYLDLSVNGYHTEIWQKTGTPAWVAQGGTSYLSQATESYGFGAVSTAPPNTQGTIGQATQCLDASLHAIANTACILFNSRGIPIDSTNAPTAAYALYATDGTAVFGVTVSATSSIRLWRTNPSATPSWVQQ
jgi:prepilin-type N-terminal cleavage/methylation domain-containing protein